MYDVDDDWDSEFPAGKMDPDCDYFEPCPCRACETEGRTVCEDTGHKAQCWYCPAGHPKVRV